MNSNKFKILSVIFLLAFLFIGLFILKYKFNLDSKRIYKQGMFFYSEENYSDAYYNFKKISPFSDLYIIALLKQYICAIKLEDKKTAHTKISELIRKTKDANLKPYALYNEAVLSFETGMISKKQYLKKLKRIINEYPDNDFAYASSYKATMLSDDRYFSKDNIVSYLKYAPVGKYSLSALENAGTYKDILTNEDKEIVADSYYLNSKYEQALNYYKDTDFSKNWYKISKCYKFLNKKDEEKATIINGFNLPQSDVEEKEIDTAIDRLISITNSNKLQILQELYTKYENSYVFPTILYNLAESSKSIRSIKLYEDIVKLYPNSSWASNSLWEIFWYNYSQMHYKTCIKLGEIHKQKYSKSSDAPRVAYWSARAMLHEKDNQAARDTFYEIIRNYPLSYYAFLSARRLKISKAKKIIVKKPIPSSNINSINKFIFNNDPLLMFLANNDDFKTIEELKINNEYIKSWLMYKKQNYSNSINTAKNEYLKTGDKNEINISYLDKELKLIFPVLYEEEINEYALKYRQSPLLFMSLIREESHFNKNAKSSAGAIGLVQLMPATASFIEKTTISSERLKKDNIEIGLKYFKYLYEMFDRNEYLAILAYNAGPGNVKKWMNSDFAKSGEIDEFVENIPYLETKNYIKKVLSTYWSYYNIYK